MSIARAHAPCLSKLHMSLFQLLCILHSSMPCANFPQNNFGARALGKSILFALTIPIVLIPNAKRSWSKKLPM